MLGLIQNNAAKEREVKGNEMRQLKQRLHNTEKELDEITARMKEKIGHMVEDVERKVHS